MDHFWYLKAYQKRRKLYRDQIVCDYRTPPERIFQYLASNRELLVANSSNSANEWVSARFTPSDDTLLCLGGNDGSIGLYNVLLAIDETTTDVNAGMVSCVKAHSGAVMGVYGVPGQSNNLLSIGGDGTAKLFDMERKTRISCFDGHETIVRSASFAPDSPNEFATCGRDGKFCIHDRRCQAKKDRHGVHFIPAVQSMPDAHYFLDNGKPYKDFTNVPGLTNIIYLDENTIVTSSDKAISGIRLWDPRKLIKKPFRKLDIPHRRESKQIGIASMDVNRFSSSLFVAVTDNNIFEFSLGCSQNSPVRKYSNASTTSYDVTISASPVSDHLLSGSVLNNAALLYNTPATHSLDGDLSSHLEEINPCFKLAGHDSDITAVSWSSRGTYIVTLDESSFRIWSPNFERTEKEEFVVHKDTLPAFTRASFVGDQFEKSLSFSKFKQLTVSPSKSPFKSPVKKRMRISSACSSPFADRTNLDSPARADFQLFCKRQMTRNLPRRNNSSEVDDSIKEKPASDKKLPRKNIMEFFRQKTIDKPVAPLNDPTKASPSRNLMGDFLVASSIPAASPSSNTIKRYFQPAPHTRRSK